MSNRKLRTLVEVDREVWSRTKAFATIQNITLSESLYQLLNEALVLRGFNPITQSFTSSQFSQSCDD